MPLNKESESKRFSLIVTDIKLMMTDAWWWLMVTNCDDENDDESDDESDDASDDKRDDEHDKWW